MNLTKILTNVIVMMLVSLTARAVSQDQNYNLLCNFSDGTSALIHLPERKVNSSTNPMYWIALNEKSVRLGYVSTAYSLYPEGSLEYTSYLESLKDGYEFTFDKLDFNNPFSLIDSSVSSMEDVGVDRLEVIITPIGNGVLKVSGAAVSAMDDISVFSLTGHRVDAGISRENDSYIISLEHCMAGVYVFKVSGVTIKVMKR